MGYYSIFDGGYAIRRKDSKKKPDRNEVERIFNAALKRWGEIDIAVRLEEYEGRLFVEPYQSEMKGYSFDHQVLTLFKAFSERGYVMIGCVQVSGEDPGDIWRIACDRSGAFQQKARIVFEARQPIA